MIIKESWESFKNIIIPPGASAGQVKMMQIAFYAGCMEIMSINEGLGQPGISQECGCKILSAVQKELKEYRDNL